MTIRRSLHLHRVVELLGKAVLVARESRTPRSVDRQVPAFALRTDSCAVPPTPRSCAPWGLPRSSNGSNACSAPSPSRARGVVGSRKSATAPSTPGHPLSRATCLWTASSSATISSIVSAISHGGFYYGRNLSHASALLDEKRSELSHQVAARFARARHRLSELKERLGTGIFEELPGSRRRRPRTSTLRTSVKDSGESSGLPRVREQGTPLRCRGREPGGRLRRRATGRRTVRLIHERCMGGG